jgi:phosphatidylserine/phosphatidylglycerophosphate/cardiolipin synthase-like enzyme/uncharacterized membrane protein YdjX (TVP38/TMEM64 family)
MIRASRYFQPSNHTSLERAVQPGRNCWTVGRAFKVYCIQDAADYFRLVRLALLSARRTVFSLGWDITAHADLQPGTPASEPPTRLDKLLAYVVRRRPELHCYILTWDYGVLHTLERDPLTRWRLGWRMPRGVRLRFDDHHPVGGCHHQKVVVVDDQLAFCGGIDLTAHRWDTSAHRLDEPARTTPLGSAYGPYHEVQAMLTGPAAASLGALARDRWRALGVEPMPPVEMSTDDLWPTGITPDFTDVNVAIARTVPGSESAPAIRECEALFLDSIALAKQTIYIESQYFTNNKLAGALAARLREPDGPEVIVISPKECHGWLEKTTMGAFRDGAFRQLIDADEYQRLRLVYPAASRSRGVPTFVHSKVMIVDDVLVRIGSANFSHRSMGMDTECDVAVLAGDDPNARAGVCRVRDRLLAEHLGLSAEAVAQGIRRHGSLRAFIDTRMSADRTLVPLDMSEKQEPPSELLRAAADPDDPAAFHASVESFVPIYPAGEPHPMWILPAAVLAAAAALAWKSETIDLIAVASPGLSIGVAVFVLAALLLLPQELLAIAAGASFGASDGGVVSFIGSLVSGVIGYGAGRAIGAKPVARLMSRRSYQSVRQLGARGVSGVVALHLAGVARAMPIHLLCGAGGVPFATFLAGTVIGLVPMTAVLSACGGLVRQTLLNPSLSNGLTTIGAFMVWLAVASGLRMLLLIRQFTPAISSHRGRAEYG